MNFPTFAKLRAERAAREMRGVVLPFRPRIPEQETAAENTLAAGWTELWLHLYDLWADICLEIMDIMHVATTWDSVELVEDEHSARLIQQLFEEA
jgi:hypothetical protein